MSQHSDFQTVARLDELPPLGGKEVFLEGTRICLFKHEGQVYATAAMCPHKQVPLAVGWVENCTVTCAMHGWEFDLKTGLCKNIPGASVQTFEVKVENGDVKVKC